MADPPQNRGENARGDQRRERRFQARTAACASAGDTSSAPNAARSHGKKPVRRASASTQASGTARMA